MGKNTDGENLILIDDCIDRQGKMSEWEVSFIDSISSQLAKENSLTDKQEDILEKIWDKVTKKG